MVGGVWRRGISVPTHGHYPGPVITIRSLDKLPTRLAPDVRLAARVSFYGLRMLMGQHREWGDGTGLVVRLMARLDRLHDPHCVSLRPLDFGFNGREAVTAHEQLAMMDESYFPQRPHPFDHLGLMVLASGAEGLTHEETEAILNDRTVALPADAKIVLGATAVTVSGWTVEARQYPKQNSRPKLILTGPNDGDREDANLNPMLDELRLLNQRLSDGMPHRDQPAAPPTNARHHRAEEALQRWLRQF